MVSSSAVASIDTRAELIDRVERARAENRPVRIRGGGTKDFYGQATHAELLEVATHRGIVEYEPTELVVTVRAGTPLSELEATLDEHRQMLGFEPPHFGATATIGGAVAAGLAGPRRATAGGVRDFVLGAQLLDGRAEVLNFGGKVMKNVAGYDVSRALAGSLGVLGVILEVSLKVLPKPENEATVSFETTAETALTWMNQWAGQALALSASSWHNGKLCVRLSGSRAAVAASRARIGGELLAATEASRFWSDLKEHRAEFFTRARRLWRLSLSSSAPTLDLGAAQWIEWGGALRWSDSPLSAAQIRSLAATAGGEATLFRASEDEREQVRVFPLPDEISLGIQTRLKKSFDPAGIFNRGRMYAEF